MGFFVANSEEYIMEFSHKNYYSIVFNLISSYFHTTTPSSVN